MATGFGGFSLGMPLPDAEKRATEMYKGVFSSVRAVNPMETPLDVLFEREAKGHVDSPLITLCGEGASRETATLRKVIFDADTLDSVFGCKGMNDAAISKEVEKHGAPALKRVRQTFGPDKMLGVNDEGWKFTVDHRVLTIERS